MTIPYFTEPTEYIEEPETYSPEAETEAISNRSANNLTTDEDTPQSPNESVNSVEDEKRASISLNDPHVRAVAQFMRQHSNIRIDEDDPLVLGFGFLANHMHTVNNDAFVKFDQATLQTEKFLNVIEEKKHLLLAEIMQKHKQALDFDIHYLNEINNAYWSTPMKQLQYWVKIAVACSIGAGLFALWTFIHIR